MYFIMFSVFRLEVLQLASNIIQQILQLRFKTGKFEFGMVRLNEHPNDT